MLKMTSSASEHASDGASAMRSSCGAAATGTFKRRNPMPVPWRLPFVAALKRQATSENRTAKSEKWKSEKWKSEKWKVKSEKVKRDVDASERADKSACPCTAGNASCAVHGRRRHARFARRSQSAVTNPSYAHLVDGARRTDPVFPVFAVFAVHLTCALADRRQRCGRRK